MTFYHAITVAVILCCLYLFRYYMQRRNKKMAQSSSRSGPNASKQPPALPPVQAAVGVPVEHLPNPYHPYSGILRINDPLRDNKAGYGWMDDSIKNTAETQGCHFDEDAYRITFKAMPREFMAYCLAERTNFSDFVYQIEATLLKGAEIGVVFRQTPGFRYYYFYIRRDGTYGLQWRAGTQFLQVKDGLSSAINIALNQPNVLAVVANGNIIDLYVNHQHLTTVIDDTYRAGRIGTAASGDARSPNVAVFNNLMLWTLDLAPL